MAHSPFAEGAAPAEPIPLEDETETHITHNTSQGDTQGNDGLSAEHRVTDVGDRLSQDQATDVLRDRAPANELSHADDTFACAQGRGHPSVSPLVAWLDAHRKRPGTLGPPLHRAGRTRVSYGQSGGGAMTASSLTWSKRR